MADLTITAASVVPGSDAITQQVTAGATITAGQPVYYDSTTGTHKLADADLSATAAKAVGIALHGATANQPLVIQTGGTLTIGTGTVAKIYCVSATAGAICPSADLTVSGTVITILGVLTAANVLTIKLNQSGAAVP